MITKQQYIDSFIKEIEIVKHLAEKVTPAMLDYRPTPKQRSTFELMQYMGHVSKTAISVFLDPTKNYMELAKAKDEVTFENFISKMDMQAEFIRTEIGALTEEQFEMEADFFGMKKNYPLIY